jgi:hypothetical protein
MINSSDGKREVQGEEQTWINILTMVSTCGNESVCDFIQVCELLQIEGNSTLVAENHLVGSQVSQTWRIATGKALGCRNRIHLE